jgi:hypothetical protein
MCWFVRRNEVYEGPAAGTGSPLDGGVADLGFWCAWGVGVGWAAGICTLRRVFDRMLLSFGTCFL